MVTGDIRRAGALLEDLSCLTERIQVATLRVSAGDGPFDRGISPGQEVCTHTRERLLVVAAGLVRRSDLDTGERVIHPGFGTLE